MYSGFNLNINEDFFCENMKLYIDTYKNNLHETQTQINNTFDKIKKPDINGTDLQNDWFPKIDADIFISHSHNDKKLAQAFAGWLQENFQLKAFVDSDMWGYSDDLLKKMNDQYSNPQNGLENNIVYDYNNCNTNAQHIYLMLATALQNMIDKVESVFLLNTQNSVASIDEEAATYSPWIYTEIMCTNIVQKRPLWEYRTYLHTKLYHSTSENIMLYEMQTKIHYDLSFNCLSDLAEKNLIEWYDKYTENKVKYGEYGLDALYEIMDYQTYTDTRMLMENYTPEQIFSINENAKTYGSQMLSENPNKCLCPQCCHQSQKVRCDYRYSESCYFYG